MTSLSGDRHPPQQSATLDLFTVHANFIDPPNSSKTHRVPSPRRVSSFMRAAPAKDNISDPFMSMAYNIATRYDDADVPWRNVSKSLLSNADQ